SHLSRRTRWGETIRRLPAATRSYGPSPGTASGTCRSARTPGTSGPASTMRPRWPTSPTRTSSSSHLPLPRRPSMRTTTTGEPGSHGGSGLSALGGTVRLGELVPGGTIRHSLKLNIDSANFYPGLGGYRWPAWKSDAGGAGYGGSIPEVRMGSLLAPKPDFPIDTFETEPGKIVAAAFRDYGGYIVDTSGWSIYNFVTERSPAGSVQDEFNKAWGYSLNAGVGANGWARDLDKIFTN